MAKKHNWVLIVLGVVIVLVIVGIAAVAGIGYYMYRQMEPSMSTGAQTAQEFEAARARFQGQVPFIEFTDADRSTAVVHQEQEGSSAAPIKALKLVAYDPDERKLVRMTLPMWLLKYAGDKPITFSGSGTGVQWDSGVTLKVSPNQIEKHGPGLILDTVDHKGAKVLVWAE